MGKKLTVKRFQDPDASLSARRVKKPFWGRWFGWLAAALLLLVVVAIFVPIPAHEGAGVSKSLITIFPRHLQQVELLVDNKKTYVENEGEVIVHPHDRIRIENVVTDGLVRWGIKFISESFSGDVLSGKGVRLIDFWPLSFFKEPQKIKITVLSWGTPIGEIVLLGELSYLDWIELAEKSNNVETKIFYLEQALNLPQRNTILSVKLATLYAKKGDWDEAAKIYEKIAARSDSKDITLALLKAYKKSNQVEKALKTYFTLLQKEPTVQRLSEFLTYLKKQRKPENIVKLLDANTHRIPPSLKSPFYAYLGSLEANLKRWKPASVHLEKAISLGATDPDVYYNLSIAYKELGLVSRAKKYLQLYLKKNPTDRNSELLLTQLFQLEGEKQEAITHLRKLIAQDPKNLGLHLKLLKLLQQTGKKDNLIKEYQEILKIDPQKKLAWYNLGMLYYEEGKFKKAEEALKKTVELDSTDIDAKVYLFQLLKEQEKFHEMIPLIHELIRAKPEKTEYYDELFSIYDKLHDYKNMEKDFLEASEKKPDEKIYQYLIYSLLKNHKTKQALKTYQKLLKLSPNNPKYLKEIATLYEKYGYYTEALKALSRLLKISPDDQEAQEAYLRVKMKNLKLKQGR